MTLIRPVIQSTPTCARREPSVRSMRPPDALPSPLNWIAAKRCPIVSSDTAVMAIVTVWGRTVDLPLSIRKLGWVRSIVSRAGLLVTIALDRASRNPCATSFTAARISIAWLRIGPRVTTRPSARPIIVTTTRVSSNVKPACRNRFASGFRARFEAEPHTRTRNRALGPVAHRVHRLPLVTT
jgi:hypothetical protein